MKKMKKFENFDDDSFDDDSFDDILDDDISHIEEFLDKITTTLNEANKELDVGQFEMLSESVIDYIDEISRNKK